MKRRITICLIVLAITITSFPLPVSAASKTKSRYMPTEYYVKYKYAHDGVSAEYARLKYNKYGLVTKMTITSYDEDGNKSDYISTDTFKYTYYKNKNVKTIAAFRGDNKEADFIMYFNKYGGSLGSVSYMFDEKGIIIVSSENISEDNIMQDALDAGASDVQSDDDSFIIFTERSDLFNVKNYLSDKNYHICSSEISLVPKFYKEDLDDETKEKVSNFINILEDDDDVQEVYYDCVLDS